MAKAKIEDTPDEQQPAEAPAEEAPAEQPAEQPPAEEAPAEQPPEEEFVIKDTPQGGVSVPAGQAQEDPNSSIEEKQAKKREELTKAIQSVRDLLRSTGPSPEADLAIMKLDECELWTTKAVIA